MTNDMNDMNDDRIRQTLSAEANELEARRQGRSTGALGSVGSRIGQAESDSRRQLRWRNAVLPVAAVLLAVAGVIGFNLSRDAGPDSEPPPSNVASQAPQSTAPAATAVPAATAGSATTSEAVPARDVPGPTPVGSSGRLRYHTVAPGDLLSSIAERYGVSISALVAANQLDDPGTLLIGQELLIPPSELPVATPDVPRYAVPTAIAPPIAVVPTIGVTPITTSCVTRIVAPDVLNLRSGPGLDTPIIAEMQPDECGLRMVVGVEVVDGEWAQLDRQIDDTIVRGWASVRYLRPDTGGPAPTPVIPPPVPPVPTPLPGPTLPLCVVDITAPDALMLRSGPGTGFEILREMAPGTCQLLPLGASNGWTQLAVPTADGQVIEGWASSAYLGTGRERITLTFSLSYPAQLPAGTKPPDWAAFEVLRTDGSLVGGLDTAATIQVDAGLIGTELRVQAPWANDPYCWWTGSTMVRPDARQPVVLPVELAGVCA